jgi:hypothetical protein
LTLVGSLQLLTVLLCSLLEESMLQCITLHISTSLGGHNSSLLSECERYVCAENRWEALPSLPRACAGTSGVVVESSLYALGGMDDGGAYSNSVQKLSLESLTWELMQLRLPQAVIVSLASS